MQVWLVERAVDGEHLPIAGVGAHSPRNGCDRRSRKPCKWAGQQLINAAGYCCAFPISSGVLTQAMQRGDDEVLFWCIDGTFDDTSKSRCSSHAGAHDGWAHLARVTDAVESSHSGSSDELFGWLVEDLPKWSLDSGKQFGRRRRSSAESRHSFGVKDEIAPDANEVSA